MLYKISYLSYCWIRIPGYHKHLGCFVTRRCAINPDPFSVNSLTNSLQEMLPAGASSGFSMANIVFGLIYGAIGFIAFSYGKSNSKMKPLILGIALMGFPYFVYNTTGLLLIGLGLIAALYFWRD